MAESKVEQILAGFKTDLEAISEDGGTTYWYTPNIVTRCDVFSRNLLVAQYETIYLIRDTGDDRPTGGHTGYEGRELEVWIQLHTQDKNRGETDPHRASTLTGTIRDRMIQDVTKKIESDYRRGNLAIDTSTEDTLRDLHSPDGWISAMMLFRVYYDYERGSP